jgi:LruC domain-containing protein
MRVAPWSMLAWTALALMPLTAAAQDSDSDGVPNAADDFPCDGNRASVTYFPSESGSALLTYEDQWPGATDLDFNDVAIRVHYRLERAADGDVASVHATFDPVALGGDLSNGLGLVLPASPGGAIARRRIGGGAWQTITLESDANATMVLSEDLRELFAGTTGRINSRADVARLTGQRLELEFTFSAPSAMTVSAAPFDLFIFRAGVSPRHEIHFPQYSGTASLRGGLFNTEQDGSTVNRKFVHTSGVPAALNLMTSTRYPLEGTGISELFPDIIGFATSHGQSNQSFFSAPSVVGSKGHQVQADAVPARPAPSTTCVVAAAPPALYMNLTPSGASESSIWRFDLVTESITSVASGEILNVYDGELFFKQPGAGGFELHAHDGTSTRLVTSAVVPPPRSNIVVAGGKLVFFGLGAELGYELWEYDGSTASLVRDFNPGTGHGVDMNLSYTDETPTMAVADGKVFFGATSGANEVLWAYDPAAPKVTGVNPAVVPFAAPITGHSKAKGALGTKVFFAATDATYGNEIWMYDAAQPAVNGVNPMRISDLDPGSDHSYVRGFYPFAGKMYFSYYELHVYDPALPPSGTNPRIVQDLGGENCNAYPGSFEALGEYLYFSCICLAGQELCRTDGVTITLAHDFGATIDGQPTQLTAYDGKLYLSAEHPTAGRELYVYTPASNTMRLINLNTDPAPASLPPWCDPFTQFHCSDMPYGIDWTCDVYWYDNGCSCFGNYYANVCSSLQPGDDPSCDDFWFGPNCPALLSGGAGDLPSSPAGLTLFAP